MLNTFIKTLTVGVFFGLVSIPALVAQTAGSVSGRVIDPTQASIPAATITLKNMETGTERTTVTTGAGDYTFSEVPVGVYDISATHAGFKTTSSANVEVQVQQSVRLDFALQVGDVTQSIEIQATGALLQADNGTLGTVIDNAEVTELPLNGRNYLGLVALASNVNTLSSASGQAGSRLGGDRAAQSIAVGGQRIMFDYYTLDGVSNTDPDFNTYIGLPSLDGIQEFKVQTGVYSAEYGHEASQINVVSKSGTNKYHGSAYEFIRNNYVDAQPYLFPERHPAGYVQTITPFKYNDFGFEFDGPIWIPKVYNGRDKFFFMVDDEWYRSRADNPNATAVVPTPAIAAGNFQGYSYQYEDAGGTVHNVPVTIYDPTTNAPFPNNIIPSNRVTTQSTALLAYLGTAPSAPTYLCSKPSSNCSAIPNYKYSTTNPTNRQSLTVRGDYNQSSKLQYSFRYSAGNEDITSTGLLGAGSKTITQYYQYMGSSTWTVSPKLVNEFRFGYSHFFNSLSPLESYNKDVVDSLGIPGLVGGPPAQWGIPSMSFANGPNSGGLTGTTPNIWTSFGDQGGDTPYVVQDPQWQIVDNVTLVKGKHSLRLGFEYNRQNFYQFGNQFLRGQFTSEPLTTALLNGTSLTGGDALADYLLGDIQSSTVALSAATADYVRNVESAYVDDTFKAGPKFTISAGLRYELTPPWTDQLGNLFTTAIPVIPKLGDTHSTYSTSQYPYPVRQGNCTPATVYQGLSFVWTTAGPSPTCNNGTLPNGALMDTKYTNFAPRLSFSYSPNERTVVRAGYGIFYTQDIGNAYFDMARNTAARVSYTNQNSTSLGSPSNLTWANISPFSSPGTISTLPVNTVWYANSVSHHTSYTEQLLLNIQQQLGKNWSFEMGYQGALSRHLYGFINANQVTPFGVLGTAGYTISSASTPTCPACTKAVATSVASRTPFNVTSGGSPQGVQYVHDEGTGNYNAGTFKVNRRFSHGADLIASYTYSKSLDDTSGIRNQGNDNLYPQNSYCVPCEYGPSAFDVRNRVVVSGLYELPIGIGKPLAIKSKVLDAVIGGWQAGGTFTHQTGGVATPLYGIDNSGIASPFGNFDRPNQTGISPYVTGSARTVDNWVNKAAWSQPGLTANVTTANGLTPTNIGGLFGNATRSSFTGPGFTNLDASLHKDFAMPYNEKHKLSIRFEAFNALNHPNWTTPNITYTSSSLGQVNAGGMRVLQLAAKYTF